MKYRILIQVFRIIAIFLGIAWLVLSPLGATGLMHCECLLGETATPAIEAGHCCQTVQAQTCCLETHHDITGSAELIVETSSQPRFLEPVVVALLSPAITIKTHTVKVLGIPRAEHPPGDPSGTPSLFQTWLI